MHPIVRLLGIGGVFAIVTIAWLIFGAVMVDRTSNQSNQLHGQVAELWGSEHAQQAPQLTFERVIERDEVSTEQVGDSQRVVRKRVKERVTQPRNPSSTHVTADVELDQRLKGLMWYSLYNVTFNGRWTYTHTDADEGELRIAFAFPDSQGLYDDFRFVVNGEERANSLSPEQGRLQVLIPVQPGDELTVEIGYRSRGMNTWAYVPAQGVANLEDFHAKLTTDFHDIDFPAFAMSPSTKTQTDDGWTLSWDFAQVVTGHRVGIATPQRLQPGEPASALSFSAPISLFFFFLVLFVLGTLRRIEIHPMNYLFLGAAFFAFHLLFGYSVDHLHVVPAFALSSVVSMVLVVTYLRLVVSARFAFIEAALAQLIYLVGFSLAHFWDGYTGLTVTVLSIFTLFLVMQWTGRINWSEALSRKSSAAPRTPSGHAGSAGDVVARRAWPDDR
ncbi:MAG: hypothetical protein CMH57_11240 [Myxococcales bacterium]|nr:hypothetical protein [Myxococcales bacterium]